MKYVIGIGEALFDCLPEGRKLGGAPANFAYHVSQFGLNGCAISAIGDDWLEVNLIPVTASETTLGAKKPGDAVNLEGDVVGKYISKAAEKTSLTEEKLAAAGFI